MTDHDRISEACAKGLDRLNADNGVLAYVPGGCIAAATNSLGPAPLGAEPRFVDTVIPGAKPRRVRIYLRVNKPPKRPKGCQPYWCAYRAEWLPDDETVRNSA
jgi:hypothetical protein